MSTNLLLEAAVDHNAAAQAKQRGLTSIGFGRWADPRTNKWVATTVNGKLMPHSAEHQPDVSKKERDTLDRNEKRQVTPGYTKGIRPHHFIEKPEAYGHAISDEQKAHRAKTDKHIRDIENHPQVLAHKGKTGIMKAQYNFASRVLDKIAIHDNFVDRVVAHNNNVEKWMNDISKATKKGVDSVPVKAWHALYTIPSYNLDITSQDTANNMVRDVGEKIMKDALRGDVQEDSVVAKVPSTQEIRKLFAQALRVTNADSKAKKSLLDKKGMMPGDLAMTADGQTVEFKGLKFEDGKAIAFCGTKDNDNLRFPFEELHHLNTKFAGGKPTMPPKGKNSNGQVRDISTAKSVANPPSEKEDPRLADERNLALKTLRSGLATGADKNNVHLKSALNEISKKYPNALTQLYDLLEDDDDAPERGDHILEELKDYYENASAGKQMPDVQKIAESMAQIIDQHHRHYWESEDKGEGSHADKQAKEAEVEDGHERNAHFGKEPEQTNVKPTIDKPAKIGSTRKEKNAAKWKGKMNRANRGRSN